MAAVKFLTMSAAAILATLALPAAAQSNSLFMAAAQAQQQAIAPPKSDNWPTASVPIQYGMAGQANAGVQNTSLFAVQLPPPRVFKVHDLVTVIIREQKQYKHDADLETKKEFDINTKLQEWFRIHDHKWQQQTFPNGKPQITAMYEQELKDSGGTQRSDELITRITVEIIDIKPNGTLSLKGHKFIKTDEEEQQLELTGSCRAEDIGPDNSILSTQVHDLNVVAVNKGAVRDASRRGWIPKLLDKARPF